MAEQQTKPPEAKPEGEQPPQPEQAEKDNSAIREMRAHIERLQAEAKEAKDQKKIIETQLNERRRAEMTKEEQQRAEIEELRQYVGQADQLREKVGGWESWAKGEYESDLAKVADDSDRDTLRRMSSQGDWRERLEALKGAKVMYGQRVAAEKAAERAKAELEKAQQQRAYGTPTQPQAPRHPQQPATEQRKFDRNSIPPWSGVLKPARRPGQQTESET